MLQVWGHLLHSAQLYSLFAFKPTIPFMSLCPSYGLLTAWCTAFQSYSLCLYAFYAIDCIVHSYTAIVTLPLYAFKPFMLYDIDCIVYSYSAIFILPLRLCAFYAFKPLF